jgi:hypothetical protein
MPAHQGIRNLRSRAFYVSPVVEARKSAISVTRIAPQKHLWLPASLTAGFTASAVSAADAIRTVARRLLTTGRRTSCPAAHPWLATQGSTDLTYRMGQCFIPGASLSSIFRSSSTVGATPAASVVKVIPFGIDPTGTVATTVISLRSSTETVSSKVLVM